MRPQLRLVRSPGYATSSITVPSGQRVSRNRGWDPSIFDSLRSSSPGNQNYDVTDAQEILGNKHVILLQALMKLVDNHCVFKCFGKASLLPWLTNTSQGTEPSGTAERTFEALRRLQRRLSSNKILH